MRRLRLSLSTLLLAALVTLVGCGGKKSVTINGKLVLPDKMALQKEDSVEIRFAPTDAKAKGASTSLDVAKMEFVAKDIVPGAYKLTVTITPYAGTPGADKRALMLENFNKAFDAAQTKLNVEITDAASQNLTVDLGKGTVSKN